MTKQPVICQNCHAEMTPGKKTRSKVMEWTEYICPNGCSPWSGGKPLPGHEPVYAVPKVGVVGPEVIPEVTLDEPVIGEAEVVPEPKPKSKPKRKRKSKAAKAADKVIESEGEDG